MPHALGKHFHFSRAITACAKSSLNLPHAPPHRSMNYMLSHTLNSPNPSMPHTHTHMHTLTHSPTLPLLFSLLHCPLPQFFLSILGCFAVLFSVSLFPLFFPQCDPPSFFVNPTTPAFHLHPPFSPSLFVFIPSFLFLFHRSLDRLTPFLFSALSPSLSLSYTKF